METTAVEALLERALESLQTEIQETGASVTHSTLPEIQEGITRSGMGLMDSPSVEALQDFIKSEIVRWGKVVEQAGIAGSQ